MINGVFRNDDSGAIEDEKAEVFDFDSAEAVPHGHEGAAGVTFRQLVSRLPGNQEREDGGVRGVLGAELSKFEEMRVVSGSEDVRVGGAAEVGDV